jgi:hypothetical protein
MLRNDGAYKIYVIQHLYPKTDEWAMSIYGSPEIRPNEPGIRNTFTASGICWQQTGINGVYDLEDAKLGLKMAIKHYKMDVEKKHSKPGYKFRIACISIIQQTTPI